MESKCRTARTGGEGRKINTSCVIIDDVKRPTGVHVVGSLRNVCGRTVFLRLVRKTKKKTV